LIWAGGAAQAQADEQQGQGRSQAAEECGRVQDDFRWIETQEKHGYAQAETHKGRRKDLLEAV